MIKYGRLVPLCGLVAAAIDVGQSAKAATTIPFDGTRNQVVVHATLQGKSLTFLVDTAVTPSVIDLEVARAMGLSTQESPSGTAAGVGSNNRPYFPAEIRDLLVGGLKVDHVEAVAFDMGALSRKFGQRLEGILGQSFLDGRIILIDYPGQTIKLFETASAARRAVGHCSQRYTHPLQFVSGDLTPKLKLRIAGSTVPVTLDTGSSHGLQLYEGSFSKAQQAQLLSKPKGRFITGARGEAAATEAQLNATVRLGPFRWVRPTVILSGRVGLAGSRVGNFGNRLLRGKRLLLNYKDHELGIYAACAPTGRHAGNGVPVRVSLTRRSRPR